MKRTHSILLTVGSTLAVVLAATLGAYYYQLTRARVVWNYFNSIQENEAREAVIEKMGKPDVVRACGAYLYWGDDAKYRGPNMGKCVTEERYEFLLTAYGIGYSTEGKVVSKYQYVSE